MSARTVQWRRRLYLVLALAVASAAGNAVVYEFLSGRNPIFLLNVAISLLVVVALLFPALRRKLWPRK
ncbi:hypothetical protein [Microbacterium paraoxydans]|uniref:hypothetical protein n=1 Tax=Microbacterium paraoxydans TaxID=199592 RepID=UPI003D75F2CB